MTIADFEDDFTLDDFDTELESITPPGGLYTCTVARAMRSAHPDQFPKAMIVFKILETEEILENDPRTGERLEPPDLPAEVFISWTLNPEWRNFIGHFKRIMGEALGADTIKGVKTEQLLEMLLNRYEAKPLTAYFVREMEKNPPRAADGTLVGEPRYWPRIRKILPSRPTAAQAKSSGPTVKQPESRKARAEQSEARGDFDNDVPF